MSEAKEIAAAAIASLGLSIRAEFVPFSRSRNAKPDADGKTWLSLNWIVTVVRNGRDVLTTDYGAGSAHCPADKSRPPVGWPYPDSEWKRRAIAWEIENGRTATFVRWATSDFGPKPKSEPLMPDTVDVFYSLQLDTDVIDASGFEEWARDLGYDLDSRKAEATYRACLAIALKLRAAIGDAGLESLRNSFQDY